MSTPKITDHEITNLDKYNNSMMKSYIDKIFFMDKVDANIFIDYGCADGELIKRLARLFPDCTFVGYDICEKMIEVAKQNNPDNIAFYSDYFIMKRAVDELEGVKCVILNSIIHEVYAYGAADEFWSELFNLNTDYIAMRDMCVSKTASRPSDPIKTMRVRQLHDCDQISGWESRWGSLDENWSLTHFLLTYRYQENWARESRENYLPIPKEELIQKFPRQYRPIHQEHYTLPFIRQKVMEDFDIDLCEQTHLKLIFRRY